MAGDQAYNRLRRVGGTAAKLLFAAAVFCAILAAYYYLTPAARRHMPLPDRQVSDGRCAVWLVGSSSIHRWKTAEADLDGWQVHNRGIEGARLPELQQRLSLEETVTRPDAIVLYAGENDLSDGVSASTVLANLAQVAATLARHAPDAKLFIVSMKPSPARWANRTDQLRLNAGLHGFVRSQRAMAVIDAGDLLLTDGRPGNYYQEDGIHLAPAGYLRWGGEIERQLDTRFKDASTRCGSR